MQRRKSSTQKRKNARTRHSRIQTHTTKDCTHELCDVLQLEAIVVQCVGVGNVGFSLGSLAGFHFFWGFRCVGELEVICT